MNHCKAITSCNQEGGVGKTTTTVNLGIGPARAGKRVLLVDADPPGDLTTCLGGQDGDNLAVTIADLLPRAINEQDIKVNFISQTSSMWFKDNTALKVWKLSKNKIK